MLGKLASANVADPAGRTEPDFAAAPGNFGTAENEGGADMKALILVLSLLLTTPALADTRVVEGDIIEMDGETIRIMGLATPKTWRWQPKCLAGKMLGLRARAYAQELVPRIESIEEHGKDQNGQILARVVLDDGMDWAEAMIERGLAVPFECPDGKCTPLTNTKGH